MSKVPFSAPVERSVLNREGFLTIRKKLSSEVQTVFTAHDTYIGVLGSQADLTVNGTFTVTNGAQGVLKLPDGTPSIRGGENVVAALNADGTVTIDTSEGRDVTEILAIARSAEERVGAAEAALSSMSLTVSNGVSAINEIGTQFSSFLSDFGVVETTVNSYESRLFAAEAKLLTTNGTEAVLNTQSNTLRSSLLNEISVRTTQDAGLASRITSLDAALLQETSNRTQLSSSLSGDIRSLAGSVSNTINSLSGSITGRVTSLEIASSSFASSFVTLETGVQNDRLLVEQLNLSTNTLLGNVESLSSNLSGIYASIANEASARLLADNLLAAKDNALNAKILNETSQRTAADTAIYDYLTNLSSSITQRFDSISVADQRFTSDLPVSLAGGKTFGRFVSGDTIPALGKTVQEVFNLALVEPINPSVSLVSPTSVRFNQADIANVINFSHVINSLSASLDVARLEWRRGDTGSWLLLSSGTMTTGTFTHALTDTAFNTLSFNYRYFVKDTVGAEATATLSITPAAYIAPSISLTVSAVTSSVPETAIKREKGNINSNIVSTITRNSPLVDLISCTVQWSIDNTTWQDVTPAISIGPGTATISAVNHNDTSLKSSNTIFYRSKVMDTYKQHLASAGVFGGHRTVSFLNMVYAGSSISAVTDSVGIRSLANRIFTDGSNPLEFETGNVNRRFTIALPSPLTISLVTDVDALNANITNNYVNVNPSGGVLVDDAGGTPTLYNVYTMTNAEAYTPDSHTHRITRA